MAKCILMSIKPKYVSMILNKTKTIEVRKRFPKDYVGWVYVYCTKNEYLICDLYTGKARYHNIPKGKNGFTLSGKVVARFWCDRVDEFYDFDDDLCEQACLDRGGMLAYLGDKKGYAIHITKLEIFDKPKEINEFWNNGKKVKGHNGTYQYSKLTSAPQSFCFIEV